MEAMGSRYFQSCIRGKDAGVIMKRANVELAVAANVDVSIPVMVNVGLDTGLSGAVLAGLVLGLVGSYDSGSGRKN